MAMRRIRNEMIIPFKPKKGFQVTIPSNLLLYDDLAEQRKIRSLWRFFHTAATSCCEARYSWLSNKQYRKAAFKAQMDRLCKDFSRRTENLKVVFVSTANDRRSSSRRNYKGRTTSKEVYQLRFFYLTDIPESTRNAPYVTAEIPPAEIQAFGTYVSDRYDTGFRLIVEQLLGGGTAREIPSAPIEILEDYYDPTSSGSERSTSTASTTVYISEEEAALDLNPPMATAVVAATMEELYDYDDDEEDYEDDDGPVFAIARIDN